MMLSFEEWLALSARVPFEKWTFRQYSDYLMGWRNSMPWSYPGMGLSYDNWAESRWDDIQNKERLVTAWKQGTALCASAIMINTKTNKKAPDKWEKPIDRAWANRTPEEAADFMLTVPKTLEALVVLGLAALSGELRN